MRNHMHPKLWRQEHDKRKILVILWIKKAAKLRYNLNSCVFTWPQTGTIWRLFETQYQKNQNGALCDYDLSTYLDRSTDTILKKN